MCEPAVVRTPFCAEEVLDRDRDAVERQRLAACEPLVRGFGHRQRALRGCGDIGVERPHSLDRIVIGLRSARAPKISCERARRAPRPEVQRGQRSSDFSLDHLRHGEKASLPLWAVRGALPRIASRQSPSVTSSSRIGRPRRRDARHRWRRRWCRPRSVARPSSRICDSSSASGSSSASESRMRAKVAICATVALSNAMISCSEPALRTRK